MTLIRRLQPSYRRQTRIGQVVAQFNKSEADVQVTEACRRFDNGLVPPPGAESNIIEDLIRARN